LLNMADRVEIAVIDASTDDASPGCEYPRQTRYLTSIANRPLISHVIDSLARGGIESIVIASGSKVRQQLAPVIRDGEPWGAEVSFFETAADVRGWALLPQMRDLVAGRPVLMQPADCLFTDQVMHLRECFNANALDVVLLVASGTGRSGAIPRPVRSFDSIRLPRERPQGTALVLGGSVWPMLEEFSTESISIESMIHTVDAAGGDVRACEVGEHWCYCGSCEQLLAANRIVLDAMPTDSTPARLTEDIDAQGRVIVSPSARVSRSALRGPVVIGPGAVVSDSFIGPYTAIGSGATVVGAEIDYTMVLDDAEIRYPGQRLQSSVIGKGALVSKTFELPTGLRLELSPGSSVILG
jgi:glucose-1-phosphate thymidylyltransferase